MCTVPMVKYEMLGLAAKYGPSDVEKCTGAHVVEDAKCIHAVTHCFAFNNKDVEM